MMAALLLMFAPVELPARGLPTHVLDETRTTLVAEAGDRVEVRLRETGATAWRRDGLLPTMFASVGAPGGTAMPGRRSFAFQLRRAGKATLVFRQGEAVRRFTVEAR